MKQIDFIIEMPIDCAARNTGLLGNMLHCGTADATFQKNLTCRLDKALPSQFRIFFRFSGHGSGFRSKFESTIYTDALLMNNLHTYTNVCKLLFY